MPLCTIGTKSKGEGVLVTWDAPDELESYIKKLQAAADRLATENRRLRKNHFVICDKVWNEMLFLKHCGKSVMFI